MSKLILILGKTGAGKTTYCTALCMEEGARIFSIDKWMKALFWPDMDGVPDNDWFLQNATWYMERINRCEHFITQEIRTMKDSDLSIILDFGFTSTSHRMQYLQLAEELGMESEIHFLDVSPEDRWARVERRNHEQGDTFSMQVSREMFDYIESIFEPITAEEERACTRVVRITPGSVQA